MLIAGNWKMNTDLDGAVDLATGVVDQVDESYDVQVAVCPPFISLEAVSEELDGSPVALGAQTMHHEDYGAYTGAISAPMLASVNCSHVILGHSERRQYFAETDADVNRQVQQAVAYDLIPIICVGESLEQRKAGKAQEVVRQQVSKALEGVTFESADQLVIAYEPIWAIGTGETATPEQAQEMHKAIRSWLGDLTGLESEPAVHILYGGSMKPHNADALLSQPDIDGGLIGGASLTAEDFGAIIDVASDIAA